MSLALIVFLLMYGYTLRYFIKYTYSATLSAIIQSACRHGQDYVLKFKRSVRMGKKGDLSGSERAMFVGVGEFEKLLI